MINSHEVLKNKCLNNYLLLLFMEKDCFRAILESILNGHKINIKSFFQYPMAIGKLYVDSYSWLPMNMTVPKYLRDGIEIIKNSLLS